MSIVRVLALAAGMAVGSAVLLGSAAVEIGRAGELPFDPGGIDTGRAGPERWGQPFDPGS
jgi:hypothetical protein